MSNHYLKAKNKKTNDIEIFTAIDNGSSYDYLSEDLYKHYSSKEFNELYEVVDKDHEDYLKHEQKLIWARNSDKDETKLHLNGKNRQPSMDDILDETWRDRFEYKYRDSVFKAYPEYIESHQILLNDIKNFFQQELERICEEVGKINTFYTNPRNKKMIYLDDIINIIKK